MDNQSEHHAAAATTNTVVPGPPPSSSESDEVSRLELQVRSLQNALEERTMEKDKMMLEHKREIEVLKASAANQQHDLLEIMLRESQRAADAEKKYTEVSESNIRLRNAIQTLKDSASKVREVMQYEMTSLEKSIEDFKDKHTANVVAGKQREIVLRNAFKAASEAEKSRVMYSLSVERRRFSEAVGYLHNSFATEKRLIGRTVEDEVLKKRDALLKIKQKVHLLGDCSRRVDGTLTTLLGFLPSAREVQHVQTGPCSINSAPDEHAYGDGAGAGSSSNQAARPASKQPRYEVPSIMTRSTQESFRTFKQVRAQEFINHFRVLRREWSQQTAVLEELKAEVEAVPEIGPEITRLIEQGRGSV